MGYRRKLAREIARAEAAGELRVPGLYVVDVEHDDDCARLAGADACTCDPNVSRPRRWLPARWGVA